MERSEDFRKLIDQEAAFSRYLFMSMLIAGNWSDLLMGGRPGIVLVFGLSYKYRSSMAVTLNLPPDSERALQRETQAGGLSLDEFLCEVVLSRAEHPARQSVTSLSAQLVLEEGVPVLRTGHTIGMSVVDETLDRIFLEREHGILGLSN